MCGIIGIVSGESVVDRLVDGLRRMEYRGYDSAGVCTLDDGRMVRRRAQGKLANLVEVLAKDSAPGNIGIAHTRWATHGAPTAANAHPHAGKAAALWQGEYELGGSAKMNPTTVSVRKGEVLSLIIGARKNSHICDLTSIEFVIGETSGAKIATHLSGVPKIGWYSAGTLATRNATSAVMPRPSAMLR